MRSVDNSPVNQISFFLKVFMMSFWVVFFTCIIPLILGWMVVCYVKHVVVINIPKYSCAVNDFFSFTVQLFILKMFFL